MFGNYSQFSPTEETEVATSTNKELELIIVATRLDDEKTEYKP